MFETQDDLKSDTALREDKEGVVETMGTDDTIHLEVNAFGCQEPVAFHLAIHRPHTLKHDGLRRKSRRGRMRMPKGS